MVQRTDPAVWFRRHARTMTPQELFLDPYKQGFYNVRDGIRGRKVVSVEEVDYTITRPIDMKERAMRIGVGVILLIPIINTVAMVFLKILHSVFLYTKLDLPARPPSPLDPVVKTLRINEANLSLAPKPVSLEKYQEILQNAAPEVECSELLQQFDEIFAEVDDSPSFCEDQGLILTKEETRNRIESFIRFAEHGRTGNRGYDVAPHVKMFLQLVVLELRKPHELDRKREALRELARAAGHCDPRKYEEVKKAYLKLSTQQTEVDNGAELKQVLLTCVQMAKEDLFTNYYSLSREPAMLLHKIQKLVGAQLGLDCDPINLADPHMHMGYGISPETPEVRHMFSHEFLEIFYRIYTPRNLIPIVRQYLNGRIAGSNEGAFTTQLSLYISQEIKKYRDQGRLTDAEVDALPDPYQYDMDCDDKSKRYHLTDLGVKFLLVHFGILTDTVRDGHLARVSQQEIGAQAVV